jgi:hypothetical protein
MPARPAAAALVALLAGALLARPDELPAAAPKPARLTLRYENAPLARVLADVARQTGVTVEDRVGPAARPVSVNVADQPFWPALDAVAAAAGARVDVSSGDGRLALARRPADYRPPPTSYRGPFRTTVPRVAASLDLETGRAAYTATLEVAWEPGLRPLLLETSPRDLVVRADKGGRLPAVAEGSVLAPVDGRLALAFDVPLPAVPRGTARLAALEGKLTAVAPSKMLTFDFGPLDRLAAADDAAKSQAQEGVTCRVGKVVLAADRWTAQILVDYPPGGTKLESYQSWVVNNELLLESAGGARRVVSTDYVLESSTARRAVLSYHFRDKALLARTKPADWRVVYRTPASLVEVPFTFSFADVPLP